MTTLKGRDILCIAAIDWDCAWQGMHEIMSTLAAQGNRVLIVETSGRHASRGGFRKVRENLYVYSPWIPAFLLRQELREWMAATGFRNPVIWSFLYDGLAPMIASAIEHSALIYHCLFDFKKPPADNSFIRSCTMVFAQSEELRKKCAALNPRSYAFPFGVNPAFCSKAAGKIPFAMEHVKKPVVGYAGPLDPSLDLLLIREISHIHPEWSLVLAGPVSVDLSRIKTLGNIHIINCSEPHALAGYVRCFDAGIIPYAKNAQPQMPLSTLANQYHAMGKPAVTTPAAGALSFNKANEELMRVAETPAGFIAGIEDALARDSNALQERRRRSAKAHAWPARIEQMSGLIAAALEKTPRTPNDWKKAISRQRMAFWLNALKVSAAAVALYLALFFTPLVWYAASWLKVSHPLEKADAVAVFMEDEQSPRATYEELVPYAAALYKNGYAPKIIFSSGNARVFTEAMLMRNLALSLEVPKEAIILDPDAKTMREKAVSLAELSYLHSWKKVLLVSSPYSTRRAQRAVMKTAPGLTVLCAPIPYSLYYDRPSGSGILRRQANLGQVVSLAREAFKLGMDYLR